MDPEIETRRDYTIYTNRLSVSMGSSRATHHQHRLRVDLRTVSVERVSRSQR